MDKASVVTNTNITAEEYGKKEKELTLCKVGPTEKVETELTLRK